MPWQQSNAARTSASLLVTQGPASLQGPFLSCEQSVQAAVLNPKILFCCFLWLFKTWGKYYTCRYPTGFAARASAGIILITPKHLKWPPGNIGFYHHCSKKWPGARLAPAKPFLEPMLISHGLEHNKKNSVKKLLWLVTHFHWKKFNLSQCLFGGCLNSADVDELRNGPCIVWSVGA